VLLSGVDEANVAGEAIKVQGISLFQYQENVFIGQTTKAGESCVSIIF